MKRSKAKGILVTGTHRSGTTWMGRILSLPEDVVYFHEPFNLETSNQSTRYEFKHWFPHIPDIADSERLFRAMEKTLGFRHAVPRPGDWAWYRGWPNTLTKRLDNLTHRLRGHTPLIKDPIALFSAAELAERFDLDVVCMIRHPLAFCSSLKKWDWKFPFNHFLEQPKLMERHFNGEATQIADFASEERPVVLQATLLWNLFHKAIRNYQGQHPEWKFRRHEDMVADPMLRFEELYKELGLDFTPAVAAQLHGSLSAKSGETADTGYKARDASTVTQTWKSRLTPEEVTHVLTETSALREHFYPEAPASPGDS